MTVYVKISTVCTAIAALSIPGVTIKDLSGVPANANLAPRTLYPNPEGVIRGLVPERQSQGVQGSEKINIEYGIRYRYLHCTPNGLTPGDIVADCVSAVSSILAVILANDTVSGAVDLWLESMTDFPISVKDPAGNDFWGCDFTLHIKEFCEVAP